MKPNIKKIYIYGAVITSILGVINHFLYEWTGNNSFIALFCATNESTWEHLKLLFFPYLIWVIVSYFCIGKENEGYINTNALSCAIGLSSIVVLFYTYTGILGTSIDFINIAIYFVAVIISFYISYRHYINNSYLVKKEDTLCNNVLGIFFFAAMSLLFFIFTFSTPNLGIFIPPTL